MGEEREGERERERYHNTTNNNTSFSVVQLMQWKLCTLERYMLWFKRPGDLSFTQSHPDLNIIVHAGYAAGH